MDACAHVRMFDGKSGRPFGADDVRMYTCTHVHIFACTMAKMNCNTILRANEVRIYV